MSSMSGDVRMKKLALVIGLLIIVGLCIPGALAKSPWQVSGTHYNLNIIGAKTTKDVGASDGHTMFVKLDGKTKIIMTQDGGGFLVTDRNGLDGTASFNLGPGHYNVYARGLGKPGGSVHIHANGTFTDALDGTVEYILGSIDISRVKGRPVVANINSLFYVDVSICTAVDASGTVCTAYNTYENVWVFDIPELLEYYWDYTNSNLKLLQVRFYECTVDSTGTAPDFCRDEFGNPIVSRVNGAIVNDF